MMNNVVVNNKKAVIYARYSSDSQTEQSIEGQVRVITDYAKSHNIPIIDSYIDRAISGTREDRPEFQRMLKEAKNKAFGYVLVYKYDRFSRDRLTSLLSKKELGKNGVKVISVTEYISDDPQGILFESIIDGYSEYYSAELAQKVRRGNRESRLKGLYTGGHVIYGYKIVDKKYQIIEEEAVIIKKIFDDIVNGKTFKEICDELNAKGLTHKGSKFTVSFISKLVLNEKYIGKITTNGELFTNIVPAIIDEKTFYAAKNNSANNQHRSGHFRKKWLYNLAGKVYCGYCGDVLVGESGTGHGKIFHYYKCNSVKKHKVPCNKKTVKQEWLEDIVLEKIKTSILMSSTLNTLASELCKAFNSTIGEDKMLTVNEKALSKNKKETDNIVNIMASGFINDALKEKLNTLSEEKKILELENLKLKAKSKNKLSEEDAIKFLASLLKMDDNSPEYKKMMLDRFVKKVILFNDKIQIELYPIDNRSIFDIDNKNSNSGGKSSINDVNNTSNTTKINANVSDLKSIAPPFD